MGETRLARGRYGFEAQPIEAEDALGRRDPQIAVRRLGDADDIAGRALFGRPATMLESLYARGGEWRRDQRCRNQQP
ncbi:MAG: hypothetical protein A3H25_06030 [Sphingomonadales bacterium RIFCSPLOWO2_12_FULL_63_15]|nr:MAG: hypothetical protein A3H25_06030 [Sphingomonadales bacterium RIFCSPLOWO2_12_FULL_63_15]